MKYGLYLPPAGDMSDVHVLMDLAQLAENAGWDGFFIWDHISVDWAGRLADTWVALTAIALHTNRIHFGPMVTPISRRNPWKLARETATLDNLAPNRLILGVGLGYYPQENLNEPKSNRRRLELTIEGLEILTGLWKGEPFSFKSDNFEVESAVFVPKPAQEPRIPIWIAGKWPKKGPFRRAAKWDGIFPLSFEHPKEGLHPEDVEAIKEFIDANRIGQNKFDIVRSGMTGGHDRAQDATSVARFAEAGATWWFENINPWRFGVGRVDSGWPMELIKQRIQAGPPISS